MDTARPASWHAFALKIAGTVIGILLAIIGFVGAWAWKQITERPSTGYEEVVGAGTGLAVLQGKLNVEAEKRQAADDALLTAVGNMREQLASINTRLTSYEDLTHQANGIAQAAVASSDKNRVAIEENNRLLRKALKEREP